MIGCGQLMANGETCSDTLLCDVCVSELRAKNARLTEALWRTATALHALQKHPGVFDECAYSHCRAAAAALKAEAK